MHTKVERDKDRKSSIEDEAVIAFQFYFALSPGDGAVHHSPVCKNVGDRAKWNRKTSSVTTES
ncbi:hypothetical protein DPMN_176634 [Dreissena polymorpha]|uniref:Uncharacterized protein n=1 Tax=Dreissena polymorpha TaxID=45954 RepID=A0A9D4IJE4_DREPO|nr:hypothetical protein DPMN_176634 [Dreissena polymorpha]